MITPLLFALPLAWAPSPPPAAVVAHPAPARLAAPDKASVKRAVRDAKGWLKKNRKTRKPLDDEAETTLEGLLAGLMLEADLPAPALGRVPGQLVAAGVLAGREPQGAHERSQSQG